MKILFSVLIAIFAIGCSQDTTQKEEVVEAKQIEVVEEKSALDKATDKAKEVKDELQEKVTEVKEDVVTAVNESTEVVSEKVEEAIDAIEEGVNEVTASEIDADLLYNKCTNCHGGSAERSALNKSGVIRDWSAKQIESALLGYQDGTYGRTMKAMMQQQVRNLSKEEIKALSIYIADK